MRTSTLLPGDSSLPAAGPVPRRWLGRDPVWIFILKLLAYGVLIGGAVVMVFPFVWALSSSLKTTGEIFDYPPRLIPAIFRVENYSNLFRVDPNFGDVSFARWFVNSVFISVTRVVLVLFLASLAGFAFAKYNFRFRGPLFLIVLGTMMLPFQVQMIPLFVLMTKLHWSDTYQGCDHSFRSRRLRHFSHAPIFGQCHPFGAAGRSPDGWRVGISHLFADCPAAGQSSAGYSGDYHLYRHVGPFLWPLIILRTSAKYTLPLGMANLLGSSGQGEQLWGLVMAGSVLATLPLLLVFLIGQKQFVSGLTTGAIRE